LSSVYGNWTELFGSYLRLRRYLSLFKASLSLTDLLFPPPKASAITSGPLKGAEKEIENERQKVALLSQVALNSLRHNSKQHIQST